MTASGRRFRGRTADERAAERRERLLDAALDLVAEDGWRRATMTAICARAGLTERYFYESFANRDALLVEVIDATAAQVDAAVRDALAATAADDLPARMRAAAEAVVRTFSSDRRRASVALLEGLGNEALQRRRREILLSFERFVEAETLAFFGDAAPPRGIDAQLVAIGLVGATSELLARHLEGVVELSDEQLIRHVAELAERMVAAR